jgi:hypothetical protein
MKSKKMWFISIPMLIFISCQNASNETNKKISENEKPEQLSFVFPQPPPSRAGNTANIVVDVYDSIIPSDPFGYLLSPESITKNIPYNIEISERDYSERYTEGTIITYSFGNSYIVVLKRKSDGKYILLEFVIVDKNVLLQNGISVGSNRTAFNNIYPSIKIYNKNTLFSIVDESESTNINIFFKDDVIWKMTFLNNTNWEGSEPPWW